MRSRNTEIALAVFRTVFLLIVLFTPQFMQARGMRGGLLVAVVIAAACYNLALFVVHVRGLDFPRFIIVIGDVSLVSLWIYFCGPGSERFFVLYYAVVIVAGFWFGVVGALLTAVFASAEYVFATTISPLPAGVERLSAGAALLQVLFLIVTAGVVSIVAEAREREREALLSSRATLQQHWQRIRIAQRVESIVRPPRLPAAPGLDVACRFRPAATAESGDYYDLIPLGGRRWGACIADVRGKYSLGIAYLPTFKTALRFAARHQQSPAAVFREVNNLVEAETAERIDPETFISLCYAVLDLDAGTLRYANAGHEPPIVIPAAGGEPAVLRGTGLVLGVLPEATYKEGEIPLHAGDTVVLFTDGLTEAADGQHRLLGREGLMAQIRAHLQAASADAMAARIFDYVNEYVENGERRDDMTLFVIRVTASDVGPRRGGEEG
ncbi:MAG: serine/threonine-protein phosphatase [Armatimonadota bacterium]|nr:MAG: serine/threonine-protein phosphatase [Armatimonadota bacterium]